MDNIANISGLFEQQQWLHPMSDHTKSHSFRIIRPSAGSAPVLQCKEWRSSPESEWKPACGSGGALLLTHKLPADANAVYRQTPPTTRKDQSQLLDRLKADFRKMVAAGIISDPDHIDFHKSTLDKFADMRPMPFAWREGELPSAQRAPASEPASVPEPEPAGKIEPAVGQFVVMVVEGADWPPLGIARVTKVCVA